MGEGHEVVGVGGEGREEEAEEEAEGQATARQVRVTLAKDRTYIQQKDYGGAWRLIVEVSEEQNDNHKMKSLQQLSLTRTLKALQTL